jgi:lipoprotein-anchoring transpeptidase ErfK/SrfK
MARTRVIALSVSLASLTLCVSTGALAEPPILKAVPLETTATVSAAIVVAPQQAEAPAVAPKPAPPAITLAAKVDLTAQRVTIFENDKPKYTWAISSGARGYETPAGSFKPGWMAKVWFSKQYDNAPMPHAVFFNGGIAMHATQATGSLGRAASHGCIRLAPTNAATFYGLVSKHGLVHTRISVTGKAKLAPEAIASRRQPNSDQRVAYISQGGYGSYGGYRGYNGYGYYAQSQSVFAQPVQYRPVRYVQIRNRY